MKLSMQKFLQHTLALALPLAAACITTGCAFEGEGTDEVEGASEDALTVDVSAEFVGKYKLSADVEAVQEMTQLDLGSDRRYTLKGPGGTEEGSFVVRRSSSGDALRLTTASGARRTYRITLTQQDGLSTISFKRYNTTFSLVRIPGWQAALASSDKWGAHFIVGANGLNISCVVEVAKAEIRCAKPEFDSASGIAAKIAADGSFAVGPKGEPGLTNNAGLDNLVGAISENGTLEVTSFRVEGCGQVSSLPTCTNRLNHGVRLPARTSLEALCYAPGYVGTRYPYSRLSGFYAACSTCDEVRHNVFGDNELCKRFPPAL